MYGVQMLFSRRMDQSLEGVIDAVIARLPDTLTVERVATADGRAIRLTVTGADASVKDTFVDAWQAVEPALHLHSALGSGSRIDPAMLIDCNSYGCHPKDGN